MLKSMTGYGGASLQDEVCSQQWEIKSVNGKQMGLRWRLPNFLRSAEAEWEREVRQVAERGRIDISLQVTILQPELMPVQLNQGAALAMLNELQRLAEGQGQTWQPDYARLLNVPSLWQETSLTEQGDYLERFTRGLRTALGEWDAFRQEEGQALVRDLSQRVQTLQEWIRELNTASDGLAQDRLQTLRERVDQLLQQAGAELDEGRMLQELALLADRLDVSEELTRLETHVQTLQRILADQSAGGRKLDFILQECFREVNTLGNKAQNTRISELVVDCKAELEKCREQVQNLE